MLNIVLFTCSPGRLPLRGTIPDMTSDSERYILLQNVYRSQAAEDVVAVTSHVQRLLQEIGRVRQHAVHCVLLALLAHVGFLSHVVTSQATIPQGL